MLKQGLQSCLRTKLSRLAILTHALHYGASCCLLFVTFNCLYKIVYKTGPRAPTKNLCEAINAKTVLTIVVFASYPSNLLHSPMHSTTVYVVHHIVGYSMSEQPLKNEWSKSSNCEIM
jgi:hypothetical protein